ncbi:hypothetical protein ES703_52453 [subsurface metagenome]
MKRGSHLVVLVVFCLALVIGAACGGGGEEEEGVTKLKWGIGIPMTGAVGAAVGVPAEKAFSMAAEQVDVFEVAGKKYRWNLIFEDNLFTIAGGNASTLKFIHEHHVKYMHQAGADPGLAAVSITEEYGMILDTAGANYTDFSPEHPYFYQTSATWSLHAPAFFHWLKDAHPEVHRVAFLAGDDRTGHAEGDAVVAAAEYYGFEMVVEEYLPPETIEYSHIATAVMQKDPDVFLGALDCFVLMQERGWDGLGASFYWTDAPAEQVGWENIVGYILFLPFAIGDHWPAAITFREEYEHRYGLELAPAAFWAANVIFVLTDALRQAGTVDDMDKILETLKTGKFDTLIGPLGFGLEALNGIGNVAIYPTPIMRVIDRMEYELLHLYTAEETEDMMLEVYGK